MFWDGTTQECQLFQDLQEGADIPPEALVSFVNTAGVAKRENTIEASLLEFCAREELNKSSKRVMVVLDPA